MIEIRKAPRRIKNEKEEYLVNYFCLSCMSDWKMWQKDLTEQISYVCPYCKSKYISVEKML